MAALVAALAMSVACLGAWFAVATPRGRVRTTGVEAAPVLWVVVLAGAAAALVAVGVLSGRIGAEPLTGGLIAALGGLGLLWTARTLARPPVVLTAELPGGARPLAASVDRLAVGHLAVLSAGLLVLAGVAVAVRSRGGR